MALTSTDDSTTWQEARDRGRAQFLRGDYDAALASFRAALSVDDDDDGNRTHSQPPSIDRQRLLSNVVACRLKLGGPAQARAAVHDAEACIALNPSWARSHVRLASAYAVLGQSNAACNALQTALRLDGSNVEARQMLRQQLSRDSAARNGGGASGGASGSATGGTGLDEDNDRAAAGSSQYPPENPDYIRPTDQPPQHYARAYPYDNHTTEYDAPVTTLAGRCQFYWQRTTHWYTSLSDDLRTALHIVVGLLLLYVAFGGRFGLSDNISSRPTLQGNYGSDNIYHQYRQQQQQQQQQQQNYEGTASSRSTYSTRSSSSSTTQPSSDYGGGRRKTKSNTGGGSSSSYYGGRSDNNYNSNTRSNNNDNDNVLLYAGLALVGVYAAHWMGMSPIQIMLFLRMFIGGGGGMGRGRRGGGFMYGGGFGGGRRGFGRRRW